MADKARKIVWQKITDLSYLCLSFLLFLLILLLLFFILSFPLLILTGKNLSSKQSHSLVVRSLNVFYPSVYYL